MVESHGCTVCNGKDAQFSLPLKKEAGKWVAKPICKKCKWPLINEATSAGKTIFIYGLEGSLKEAEKRNSADDQIRSLVKTFAVTKKMERIERYLKVARKG